MITTEQLKAIRDRAEVANNLCGCARRGCGLCDEKYNAWVRLRTDTPLLLDEVERLQKIEAVVSAPSFAEKGLLAVGEELTALRAALERARERLKFFAELGAGNDIADITKILNEK